MYKRIFCMILCLLTVLTALASCGGTVPDVTDNTDHSKTDPVTDPITDAVTNTPDPSLVLVDESGKTHYNIIIGDDCGKTVFGVANDLKSAMYDAFDVSFWVKRAGEIEADATEILVGVSSRAESSNAELQPNTYSISVADKKIVITGYNENCVVIGVMAFIEKYIKGKTGLTKLMIENETVEVADGFASLSDGWNDMRGYAGTADIDILYQIYKPENYDPAKKYPVLIFMHGNGSRGDDNSHINASSASVIPTLTNTAKYKNDIIIIAPQCLKSEQWVNCNYKLGDYTSKAITQCLSEAVEVFDYWFERISYDKNRVYLWGNSMGAYASWDLMQRYPGRFAAAVIVAGCGDVAFAPQLAKNNIWIHHGDVDPTVPFEGNKKMYDALVANGAGDNVTFTNYPGKGHTIFATVGNNRKVIDWMLSHSLDK